MKVFELNTYISYICGAQYTNNKDQDDLINRTFKIDFFL